MESVSRAMLSDNAEQACNDAGVVHLHQEKWIVDMDFVAGRMVTDPVSGPPLNPYKVSCQRESLGLEFGEKSTRNNLPSHPPHLTHTRMIVLASTVHKVAALH